MPFDPEEHARLERRYSRGNGLLAVIISVVIVALLALAALAF